MQLLISRAHFLAVCVCERGKLAPRPEVKEIIAFTLHLRCVLFLSRTFAKKRYSYNEIKFLGYFFFLRKLLPVDGVMILLLSYKLLGILD